jgi:hypothetical protein
VHAAHPIARVRAFDLLDGYMLRVHFDDGTMQVIDFEPVLEGELYGPLRDPELFRCVSVDPIAHTLVWPNGADFDPATLSNWPAHAADFERRARGWTLPPSRRGSLEK